VAQILQDQLGDGFTLQDYIARQLEIPDPLPAQMRRRLRLLSKIPFRAIVTTNFDDLIPGGTVYKDDREFRDVLRPSSDSTTFGLDSFFTPEDLPEEEPKCDLESQMSTKATKGKKKSPINFRVPVIQLHGTIKEKSTIVCSRLSYRRLLNHVPGYIEVCESQSVSLAWHVRWQSKPPHPNSLFPS